VGVNVGVGESVGTGVTVGKAVASGVTEISSAFCKLFSVSILFSAEVGTAQPANNKIPTKAIDFIHFIICN